MTSVEVLTKKNDTEDPLEKLILEANFLKDEMQARMNASSKDLDFEVSVKKSEKETKVKKEEKKKSEKSKRRSSKVGLEIDNEAVDKPKTKSSDKRKKKTKDISESKKKSSKTKSKKQRGQDEVDNGVKDRGKIKKKREKQVKKYFETNIQLPDEPSRDNVRNIETSQQMNNTTEPNELSDICIGMVNKSESSSTSSTLRLEDDLSDCNSGRASIKVKDSMNIHPMPTADKITKIDTSERSKNDESISSSTALSIGSPKDLYPSNSSPTSVLKKNNKLSIISPQDSTAKVNKIEDIKNKDTKIDANGLELALNYDENESLNSSSKCIDEMTDEVFLGQQDMTQYSHESSASDIGNLIKKESDSNNGSDFSRSKSTMEIVIDAVVRTAVSKGSDKGYSGNEFVLPSYEEQRRAAASRRQPPKPINLKGLDSNSSIKDRMKAFNRMKHGEEDASSDIFHGRNKNTCHTRKQRRHSMFGATPSSKEHYSIDQARRFSAGRVSAAVDDENPQGEADVNNVADHSSISATSGSNTLKDNQIVAAEYGRNIKEEKQSILTTETQSTHHPCEGSMYGYDDSYEYGDISEEWKKYYSEENKVKPDGYYAEARREEKSDEWNKYYGEEEVKLEFRPGDLADRTVNDEAGYNEKSDEWKKYYGEEEETKPELRSFAERRASFGGSAALATNSRMFYKADVNGCNKDAAKYDGKSEEREKYNGEVEEGKPELRSFAARRASFGGSAAFATNSRICRSAVAYGYNSGAGYDEKSEEWEKYYGEEEKVKPELRTFSERRASFGGSAVTMAKSKAVGGANSIENKKVTITLANKHVYQRRASYGGMTTHSSETRKNEADNNGNSPQRSWKKEEIPKNKEYGKKTTYIRREEEDNGSTMSEARKERRSQNSQHTHRASFVSAKSQDNNNSGNSVDKDYAEAEEILLQESASYEEQRKLARLRAMKSTKKDVSQTLKNAASLKDRMAGYIARSNTTLMSNQPDTINTTLSLSLHETALPESSSSSSTKLWIGNSVAMMDQEREEVQNHQDYRSNKTNRYPRRASYAGSTTFMTNANTTVDIQFYGTTSTTSNNNHDNNHYKDDTEAQEILLQERATYEEQRKLARLRAMADMKQRDVSQTLKNVKSLKDRMAGFGKRLLVSSKKDVE